MGAQRPFLLLPTAMWGVTDGLHDLRLLVNGALMDSELPTRITKTGLILTSLGRLLRAR